MKSSPGWFPSCPLPLYPRCSPNSTRKQHRGEHRAAELCPTLLQPPDPPGCLQLSCPTSATGGAQVLLNHCSAGGSVGTLVTSLLLSGLWAHSKAGHEATQRGQQESMERLSFHTPTPLPHYHLPGVGQPLCPTDPTPPSPQRCSLFSLATRQTRCSSSAALPASRGCGMPRVTPRSCCAPLLIQPQRCHKAPTGAQQTKSPETETWEARGDGNGRNTPEWE